MTVKMLINHATCYGDVDVCSTTQEIWKVGIVISIKFQNNISRKRRHKSAKKNLSQIDETY